MSSHLIATSMFGMTIRLFFSLAVILGAGYAVVWAARRKGLGNRGVKFGVRSKLSLGRKTSAVVVTVGERTLLLGVTENNISILAEGDDLLTEPEVDSDSDSETSTAGTPSFAAALSTALNDMKNRSKNS